MKLNSEKDNMKKEIWKDIIGYEGDYKISNYGRIKSFKFKTPLIFKNRLSKLGYCKTALSKDGKVKYKQVSRLVAEHFVKNPKGYKVVNHIDCDKLNNYYKNLEWCTQQYNCQHAIDNNLRNHARGERNIKHKLTEKDVLKIRKSEKSISELALIFNISKCTIGEVRRNKTWTHI